MIYMRGQVNLVCGAKKKFGMVDDVITQSLLRARQLKTFGRVESSSEQSKQYLTYAKNKFY